MKRIIFRIISILPALLLQYIWYSLVFNIYNDNKDLLNFIISLLSIVIISFIILKKEESTYKIAWLVLILLFPILGTILYINYGNNSTSKKLKKLIDKNRIKNSLFKRVTNINIQNELNDSKVSYDELLNNVSKYSNLPITYLDSAKYYSFGQDMFEDMKSELLKAKEFIYLEYFIIANGSMWSEISDILVKKRNENVDVRVMYDDIGSIALFNRKDFRKLSKLGIKFIPFNELKKINGQLNNRDHRKILVIDGKVAFSGGINLSDEYINVTHPYGVWKDIGFKVTGDPVKTFEYMFIEFWNAFSKDKINREIIKDDIKTKNGYVLSYYDAPYNRDHLSNDLYIELLENSKKYMYFYSPYLILGDDLLKALIRTAKRGVDVKIIVPGIPDKKIVYRLAKSYFNELIEAGVEIYTYEAGFVHAKATLSDDVICTIGTVNLDYRSLFLHFENNTIFYKSNIIKDLKKDFLNTLRECKKVKIIHKSIGKLLIDAFLRLIAPEL